VVRGSSNRLGEAARQAQPYAPVRQTRSFRHEGTVTQNARLNANAQCPGLNQPVERTRNQTAAEPR